jgi:hypothetical protein
MQESKVTPHDTSPVEEDTSLEILWVTEKVYAPLAQ